MEYKYLLVIVPPNEIIDFADKHREKYAKYTSYVIPPHITIYPPFYLKDIDEGKLVSLLQEELVNTPKFRIDLDSVGYFGGKNNVAYLNPDNKSQEYLKGLLIKATKVLEAHTAGVYYDYNFTPEKYHAHITIAEKIPNGELKGIKDELNRLKVDLSFPVSSVRLFRQQKDSKVWESVVSINF